MLYNSECNEASVEVQGQHRRKTDSVWGNQVPLTGISDAEGTTDRSDSGDRSMEGRKPHRSQSSQIGASRWTDFYLQHYTLEPRFEWMP